MLSVEDFGKKQMVYVFSSEGDKVSFTNDNVRVTGSDGKVKLQTTCYRIYALFIIGTTSITSVLIDKAHKFGFPIVLMSPSFRPIDVIGHRTDGNTLLRRLQYEHEGLDIARFLVRNKIDNQRRTLGLQRGINDGVRTAMDALNDISEEVDSYQGNLRGLMGIEGNASKLYFRNNFNNCDWVGRRPRLKGDFVNSTLDIGYTILFNYIDSMLTLFGFDTYVGVLHTEYYMRKSLTCDMVEPFRPLIDWQVRKSINLGQCRESDFNSVGGRYLLNIDRNKEYVKFLSKPLLENRVEIFRFVQSYYRSFVRGRPVEEYKTFRIGD